MFIEKGISQFGFCSLMQCLLDRPNMHLLLEPHDHTVPLYGHAIFLSNLFFEAAHQPLTATLSGNTSGKATSLHIFNL